MIKETPALSSEDTDSHYVFSADFDETVSFPVNDMIRLKAYGLSVSDDFSRPFLLLKDEKHDYTLPVAVNPLEAGVALTQANKSVAPTTPHKFTELLLESLNIKIKKCVFVEIKGHFQYVELFLENHPTAKKLKVRADEAMSLCLHLDIPMYASKEYVARSRVMNAEMDGVSQDLKAHPSLLQKSHPYIM